MNTLSVKEFVKSKNFVSIVPSIRTNTNGYPYLTFIDKDNKAENIYFSKASSENLADGVVVNKDFLSTFQVAVTLNADNQERIKLVSNSNRVSLDMLLD